MNPRLGRQFGNSKKRSYRPAIQKTLEDGWNAVEFTGAMEPISDDERNLEQAKPVELQAISVSSKGTWTLSFLKTLDSQAFFDLHMG